MTGILPDPINGGLVYRTVDGVCTNPPSVQNAYCPGVGFTTSCDLTALPTDCTARLSAAQINAIVSEMISFAECLNPTGTWDCRSLKNLCSAFSAFAGSLNDLTAPEIAALLCGDDAAGDALAGCMISGDGNNQISQGSDGRLFVPLGLGTAQPPSSDPGNMIVNGSDGLHLLTPQQTVDGIQGNTAAFNDLLLSIKARFPIGYQNIAAAPAWQTAGSAAGTHTETGPIVTIPNPDPLLPMIVEVEDILTFRFSCRGDITGNQDARGHVSINGAAFVNISQLGVLPGDYGGDATGSRRQVDLSQGRSLVVTTFTIAPLASGTIQFRTTLQTTGVSLPAAPGTDTVLSQVGRIRTRYL